MQSVPDADLANKALTGLQQRREETMSCMKHWRAPSYSPSFRLAESVACRLLLLPEPNRPD